MLESVQGMTTTSRGNLLVLLASVLPTMHAQRGICWRYKMHFEALRLAHQRSPLSSIDELLFRRRLLGRLLLPRALARVVLRDDLRVDAVELLLGEDAQEGPGEVKGLEDCPRLVGA